MNTTDGVALALAPIAGAAAGWAIGGPGAAAVLAIVALAASVVAYRLQVRPLVAVPVLIGIGAGAFIGRTVVRLICFPSACPAYEIIGAVVTAIGALAGVGLVVVLAVRSIDEYREAAAAGREPPGPAGDTEPTDGRDAL